MFRMFSSIPGLYPLDASSTTTAPHSQLDIAKFPRGWRNEHGVYLKSPHFENQWPELGVKITKDQSFDDNKYSVHNNGGQRRVF